MIWVAVVAVLLAVGRYPYDLIQSHRRFQARAREGDSLVRSYSVQCPAGVSANSWDEAVTWVQITWGNVLFTVGCIDEGDLDLTLAQMRSLVARATPAEAEGDLNLIIDLLTHARTRTGEAYLSNMRERLKGALHGYGQPSPGPGRLCPSLVGIERRGKGHRRDRR